jgi:hypothetical protein
MARGAEDEDAETDLVAEQGEVWAHEQQRARARAQAAQASSQTATASGTAGRLNLFESTRCANWPLVDVITCLYFPFVFASLAILHVAPSSLICSRGVC